MAHHSTPRPVVPGGASSFSWHKSVTTRRGAARTAFDVAEWVDSRPTRSKAVSVSSNPVPGSQPEPEGLSRAFGKRMPRRAMLGGLGAGSLALLSACTTGSSKSSTEAATTSKKPAPEATVASSIADGAVDVSPIQPLTVTAADGTLESVTVTDTAGTPIDGVLDEAKTTWTVAVPLAYASAYTIAAVATNADGRATNYQSAFTTVTPTAQIFPGIGPLDGTVAGIAMPVRVYLDSPVVDRAAFEQAMTVTSTPAQTGSWSWFSDTEVHWRPQNYWQAGTTVQVDVNIFGVAAGNGAYGKENRSISFTVGKAQVSKCDTNEHYYYCYESDQQVKSFPISAGLEEPGRYTKSGIHVVIDKKEKMTMDSTTYGLALDAGGYQTEVEWATRISNNGEFVHSAPWSLADQGVRNVSHGCINANPENAKWFQQWAQIGDPVEITGTPVPLTIDDGDIFDWTISWEDWVAGSAL